MNKPENRIHTRIVIGGVILLVAFLAWVYLMDGMTFFRS
jgi:hypothetical protein